MTAMATETTDYTDEFFAEINKGRKFSEKTKDGRKVTLHLHDPNVLDIGRATSLFDHLKAGVDKDSVRKTLVRRVCLSCIHGVDDHNVSAFMHSFPPVPKNVVPVDHVRSPHDRVGLVHQLVQPHLAEFRLALKVLVFHGVPA